MTSTVFETAFGGGWPWGQSGAHNAKPRVVRDLGRAKRLSGWYVLWWAEEIV